MSTQALPENQRKVTISRSDKTFAGVSHVLLVIWSLLVVGPLLWTLMTSFKTTREITASSTALPSALLSDPETGSFSLSYLFTNYISAWTSDNFGRYFFNTFIVVTASMFLVMLLGAMCAFFRTLPNEIAEAAQVDGAGHWTTFFRIMLPMAKPGLASIGIFNFLGLWNQLLLPLALNTKEEQYVLAQGVFNFANKAKYEVNFGSLFAAVIITIVPVLIVYMIFQRQLQGSVSQGTMK